MASIRTCVALYTCLVFAGPVGAQGKWTKLAPFPDPSEELLGASANGKMYVFCGLATRPQWTPKGLVYEYDPASDKWTKKAPMGLPSHHVAFTEYNGKIYAFGGFVLPLQGQPPAWVPIDNPMAVRGSSYTSLSILELKFESRAPGWMTRMVKSLELPRLSMSKYTRAIESMTMRPSSRASLG